jgi:hypothetical protein
MAEALATRSHKGIPVSLSTLGVHSNTVAALRPKLTGTTYTDRLAIFGMFCSNGSVSREHEATYHAHARLATTCNHTHTVAKWLECAWGWHEHTCQGLAPGRQPFKLGACTQLCTHLLSLAIRSLRQWQGSSPELSGHYLQRQFLCVHAPRAVACFAALCKDTTRRGHTQLLYMMSICPTPSACTDSNQTSGWCGQIQNKKPTRSADQHVFA